MCLLVVLAGIEPAAPLVIAANRDEYLARDAQAMTVLEPGGSGPRILGGRDARGGGTWLAVNDAGVVAGLTNRPIPEGPDRAKRSRGELPLLLVAHRSAAEAVDAFVEHVDPGDYNPSWLLVGDRAGRFFVDVTDDRALRVEALPPGVHVLENRDIHESSPKVERVHALLDPLLADRPQGEQSERTPWLADPLLDGLADLLRDHDRPHVAEPDVDSTSRVATHARCICVHDDADEYGTRSSTIVSVPAAPQRPPDVRYTDGPPCRSSWCTAGHLW